MSQETKSLWINGLTGKMGLELQAAASKFSNWNLLGGSGSGNFVNLQDGTEQSGWNYLPEHLEPAEVWIDFSAPMGNSEFLKIIQKNSKLKNKAILIGTTGMDESQKKSWIDLALERNFRLLIAPNTSLGILLSLKISQQVAGVLSPLHFDIEILETHHRAKIDAPSGTANFLADGIAKAIDKIPVFSRKGKRQTQEIGVASLRGGSVFGEHEIRFLGDNEEITISHRALSRSLFAEGALLLAQWLVGKDPGVWQLEDISIDEMLQLLGHKN